jgi:hypothetical protein
MSDRGPYAENRKLRALYALADRVAGDVWSYESERASAWIEVRRAMGGQAVVLDFTREASRDDIALVTEAIDNLTFLLALVARAAAKVREQAAAIEQLQAELAALREAPDKPPNYTAQASMLLANGRFQLFLAEKQGGEVVDSKETADAALKALLGIESKKEINADDGARRRWLDLRAEFSAWERVLT